MVTSDDRVKILDFGLAKLLDSAIESDHTRTRTASLTELGTIVGTAAYMSPEQAEGRQLDGRSDIFSFGSVLYEMVTGRRPFLADSPLSTLTKILNEDPTPPSRLAASVSPELERTILRCLRKDPARRYQTMADLKVVLEDLASEEASDAHAPASTATAPRRSPWVWMAAIPVVVLLIGAYSRAGHGERHRVRRRSEPSRSRRCRVTSVLRRFQSMEIKWRSAGRPRIRRTLTSTFSRSAPVLHFD